MTSSNALPTNIPDDTVILSEPAVLETSNKLWVEKYKPKSYFDLLSDETTNRSLLTWLKMWDKMVFNRFAILLQICTTLTVVLKHIFILIF